MYSSSSSSVSSRPQEGPSGDAVSESWESQVFIIGIEFLAVAAVLLEYFGPDVM